MRYLSTIVFVAALPLAACNNTANTINLDTNFAATPRGLVNSGGYQQGSFFRWDTRSDQIVYLGEIAGFSPVDPASHGVDQETSFEVDLGGSASVDLVNKAAVEAAIKSRTKFIIKDAQRVAYSGVFTKISDTLNAGSQNGGGLVEEWGINSAIASGGVYYLLIRDVTFGDELELSVDNSTSASASLPLEIANASFNVKFDRSGLGRIKGDNSVILFNVYVLKPLYQDRDGNKTAAFEIVHGVDLSKATQLFRKVGQSS